MEDHSNSHENNVNNVWGFLGGMLVGGLAGAVAMLLVAPQSGKRTRAKIQMRSLELRDQAANAVEDALVQTRAKAHQLRSNIEDQAEAMQQRGFEIVDEQKERLSSLVAAGKTAVQGVLNSRT
jgi:gas vesicle protein